MRTHHAREERDASRLGHAAREPDTTPSVAARRRGGAPLDAEVRSRVEGVLGHSLADIRVHTDATSDEMARDHDARALTIGRDIFLRAGQPPVTSPTGVRLLAHEAAHVVQQDLAGPATSAATPSSDAAEEITSPQHEAEAHVVASLVATGPAATRQASAILRPGPVVTAAPSCNGLQRWPWDDDAGSSGGGLFDSVASVGGSVLSAGLGLLGGGGGESPNLGGLNKLLSNEVDEEQNMVRSVANAATSATADIPILGGMVQGGALLADVGVQAAGGTVKGMGDLATGIGNAMLDPMSAVTGLLDMGEHDPGLAGYLFRGAHGLVDIASGNEKGKYGSSFGELWNNLTDVEKQDQENLSYWSQLGGGQQVWEDEPIEAASRTATNIAPLILGALGGAKGLGRGSGPKGPNVEVPPESWDPSKPVDTEIANRNPDLQYKKTDTSPTRTIPPESGGGPGLIGGIADWISDLFKGNEEPEPRAPRPDADAPRRINPTRTMDQLHGSRRRR